MRTQGWRRFGWYVWDQGRGPARRLGRAAGASASSSSSTSTGRAASRTRSCPASSPGRRPTCAPMGHPPRCAARTAKSAAGPMPASRRRTPHPRLGDSRDAPQGQDRSGDRPPGRVPGGAAAVRHRGLHGPGRRRVRAVWRLAAPRSWPPSAPAAGCRSVELAPEYVDVAIERFRQNHPRVPVTLLATGQILRARWRPSGGRRRSPGMSASWLADEIEHWPTDQARALRRNARTHSGRPDRADRRQHRRVRLHQPDPGGRDGVIVAGHGRLAAAQARAWHACRWWCSII
ncbi:MAG: hypothetical protein KatS3mg122_2121 [Caldimonas sp.]|nr:MAG: hypothetical protein KatS3mg122_2121 [Caldimonas sp.]